MTAELNELFEEASGQCGTLSDNLDTTVEAVKSMVSRAEEVWQAASKGGEETRRRLADLVSRLDDAEGALEEARGSAEGDLGSLGTKAAEVRGRVGDLLERVNEGLRELQGHEQELAQALDSRMQAAATDYGELAQRIQQVQQGLDAHLQEAAQQVADFRTTVETARGDLQQKQQDWSAAMDELEGEAKEQTQAWIKGIQELLVDQTKAMIEMANKTIDRHNQSMERLKEKFTVEAANQVAASIAPLQEKLEALVELAEDKKGELSARSEEALQRVRAALPVLDSLKAAFETTSRLG